MLSILSESFFNDLIKHLSGKALPEFSLSSEFRLVTTPCGRFPKLVALRFGFFTVYHPFEIEDIIEGVRI